MAREFCSAGAMTRLSRCEIGVFSRHLPLLLSGVPAVSMQVYARTLVELIHKSRPIELLLAINLVGSTPAVFRQVMQQLDRIKVW